MSDVEERSEAQEVFDPYRRDTRKKYLSDFKSFMNLVKSAAGTGLFAMPHAFASVGMIVGIIGTILVGILITVALHLLMMTHCDLCKIKRRRAIPYDQIVATTMTSGIMRGKISAGTASLVIDIIMLACYIGIGAVYIVFVSGIIQDLVDQGKTIGQPYYVLILFPLFLLLNLIRGLNAIAPISIIGNVLIIVAALIGAAYAVIKSESDWVYVQKDYHKYPKFLGTIFFALSSPALALAIQQDMKEPQHFTRKCGVLNWGMGTLIFMHVIIGIVGYAKYGSSVTGNFVQNHLRLDTVTAIALGVQALGIFFSYGIQCFLPISILHKDYAVRSIQDGCLKGTPYFWNIMIRIAVTLLTCVLAASIPQLQIFTSFVGALCVATLGFIVPVIVFMISHHGKYGRCKWKLILSLFILILGAIAMILATISSIKSTFDYLKE
ncbi:proton-coupled amino acid transporter-like protein CG1139 [Microplitis demolitor]|uniref:proton-coupled amino acid transporter-like protein CG1139 n=1 Tax=Microplitis demolitor TaxID=69319 RepID=UPI00235B62AD|nr:proton-coupled amino acid transporter-like protein CG1139 [Microplitis demolitor]